MEDNQIKNLLSSLEGSIPPDRLKEKMFYEILQSDRNLKILPLTTIQRVFFERPLRAACFLAVILSGTLWAFLGNGYANIFSGLVGVR